MRESRQSTLAGRGAREFEAFVAGAGGRLLHVAALLTAEPSGRCLRAQRLLLDALAHMYAEWDRLRDEDPYDRTRQELVTRFARSAWRLHRRSRVRDTGAERGVLARLGPQERLVVVLRLYEGVPEEQTAALLGLPVERVRTIGARAVSLLHSTRPPRLRAPSRTGDRADAR
ncbi:sigma factor-like helix-turn-helix DNA-binding protein [Streptomyces marianii]|uniref:sigma factor-like helix-turn-helix DNA-binding protein n=1 Tax=Streptomyces marianii TaxID=1817406 RepID=UPI0014863211|nr:sigma factor-like helix-turn-helix DNA-binding protein [Streptomyces marianii]